MSVRRIYVYRPEVDYKPGLHDPDQGIVLAEVNEPLETLLKNGCRLVSNVPGQETIADGTHRLVYKDGLENIKKTANGLLDILSKSDSRPVSIGTDLPKPSVPEVPAPGQVVPRTLLAVRNRYWQQDIGHLGKVVGQLLVSGYVDCARSQNLLQHLTELAQVCGKLHRELQYIPADVLRRADEQVDEKK